MKNLLNIHVNENLVRLRMATLGMLQVLKCDLNLRLVAKKVLSAELERQQQAKTTERLQKAQQALTKTRLP